MTRRTEFITKECRDNLAILAYQRIEQVGLGPGLAGRVRHQGSVGLGISRCRWSRAGPFSDVGLIDTVRHSASSTASPHHRRGHEPLLARRGTARDVADAVVWLAGAESRFVTGQVSHVNGGAYLGG
ncbi:MAG TPA: SDR family oxidoreductase [Casimicrobiaceae bacterium]|nr:SDR family oxidoreductase [Casimicrobiaceae bacterium]